MEKSTGYDEYARPKIAAFDIGYDV
jgi:hypothetical protein